MSTRDNSATYHRLFEGLNSRKTDFVEKCYSADVIWHGPGGKQARGHKGLKELAAMYQTAFPDMKMTIEDEVAEGDRTTIRWHVTGTHKGPLGDLAPTQKRVDLTGIVIGKLKDGRIVEEWENFDELQMLRQLGVIPPEAKKAAKKVAAVAARA